MLAKMVGPKMQDFWPRINILKGICRLMTVRQKVGMILENKVVQKLKLEKKVFNKKWSPKLIFINEKKIQKQSVDIWHRKSTLKVQFWHFLTNRNSLYS